MELKFKPLNMASQVSRMFDVFMAAIIIISSLLVSTHMALAAKGLNLPLTIMDWQLTTDPNSSDRYMDKFIVGVIKNNSKKKLPEIRIEFTVYDEEGNQVAIVSSNCYDFKPGGIWRFRIPVTDDVTRAELKGLYVPSQNSSESTSNREVIRKKIKENTRLTS